MLTGARGEAQRALGGNTELETAFESAAGAGRADPLQQQRQRGWKLYSFLAPDVALRARILSFRASDGGCTCSSRCPPLAGSGEMTRMKGGRVARPLLTAACIEAPALAATPPSATEPGLEHAARYDPPRDAAAGGGVGAGGRQACNSAVEARGAPRRSAPTRFGPCRSPA